MQRRTLWIAVAVIAVAAAGYLIAVLVPRNELQPAVIVDTTVTIPPAAPRHTAEHVTREFERAGLPVKTALRVEQGKVVYPKDGELVNSSGGNVPDMTLLDPRAGGRFVVYVYFSPTHAATIVRESPAIDPVRGQRRTILRDANVVVIVQPPQRPLEDRIRQILQSL